MGQSGRRGFLPSRDGFAFDNTWPTAPALLVPTPFGSIGIGNAAAGLCGGMVFAALDYWRAGLGPPTRRPDPGSPLYRYIVRRLLASWHGPAGVARYYLWMNLPGGDFEFDVLGRTILAERGLCRRTIESQWPRVRASLDAGVPAALGLVTVASANPATLGRNHQVLAYAYAETAGQVSIAVYDPNSGPSDDVRIWFAEAVPPAATFSHNIGIGWPVRGFFLTDYSPATPPAG